MKKNIFLLLFVLLTLTNLYAQQDTALRRQLRGKQDFSEIMEAVKTYYESPETINRLGVQAVNRYIKHWARYEWYMSSRLGPRGEIVNINQKLMDATGISSRTSLTESQGGNWVPVGPLNTTNGIGRVDRLAFHPTDPDIVYAGTTAGGLWRTTNAGATWSNLTPDIPSGGISGIVIDPVNPNTIYILTGDGDSNIVGGLVIGFGYMRLSMGVLKSTNGGSTWSRTGDFPGVDYSTLLGYRLVINPTNNDIIYACTNQGLFMSINAGTSWGLVNGGGRFFNLKFRPGSGSICYATNISSSLNNTYLWKSTTGGITWDTVNAATTILNNAANRADLAVSPDNPDLLVLLPGSTTGINGQFTGLYLSNDGGQSFSSKSITPNILSSKTAGDSSDQQSMYDLAIAISNTNSKNLVVGAVNIWHSADTGANWTVRPDTHGDIHDLGYHPANNKLWAATDGGVFSSTNNGATWISHLEGMNITQFYRMAVSQDDYNNIIGGTQDNAVKRRTGNSSYFDQVACCDGFTVGHDATNSDSVYAIVNRTIRVSPDGGSNFTVITPNNITTPMSMSMAVHTSQNGIVFLGTDRIYRWAAGAWNLSSGAPAGWFLRTCPSNGNRIYAAGGTQFSSPNGTLRRSDDGGTTWPAGNTLSNDLGFPSNFPKITSINVDPTNSLRVWITFGGFTDGMKVYYSDYNVSPNGNWINMSGSLPNVPVNCIAIDNNNNSYIGTDNGVYYRGTGMNDWVPFYNNLPYVPVTDLVISEAQNRIRAASFGRGIWSSDLYNSCDANLNITGTHGGHEFHEASNAISSDATLINSVGTKIQMRGGNEVLLKEGFTARENSEFKASIGPCGSGGANRQAEILPNRKAIVHVFGIQGSEANIEINLKQAGETEIVLTNKEGTTIRNKNYASRPKSTWRDGISVAGLPPGFYYLKLLVDNKLAHLQELIIQ